MSGVIEPAPEDQTIGTYYICFEEVAGVVNNPFETGLSDVQPAGPGGTRVAINQIAGFGTGGGGNFLDKPAHVVHIRKIDQEDKGRGDGEVDNYDIESRLIGGCPTADDLLTGNLPPNCNRNPDDPGVPVICRGLQVDWILDDPGEGRFEEIGFLVVGVAPVEEEG